MDDSHVSRLHDSTSQTKDEFVPLDRLSELPNSLILVILSLLPMIDVVRTTILSKRWKDLWTSVPCLLFQIHDTDNNLDKFCNFVCGALAQWKGTKILKFSIILFYDLPPMTDIDSWLHFAVEKQVEELYIYLGDYKSLGPTEKSYYSAPQRLFSCSSITKLSLFRVILSLEESVSWNQLKNLTIEGSDCLTEHAMNQILSGVPQLEVLNLSTTEGWGSLNIRSTSLKMLKIDTDHAIYAITENNITVRVWAPNLETLEISGLCKTRCLFDLPSLTNASLGFVEFGIFSMEPSQEMFRQAFLSVSHVENLALTDWCIKFLVDEMKKDNFVRFSNAKFLTLYPVKADGMLDVLEIFPVLAVLIIKHNELQFNTILQIVESSYLIRADFNSLAPRIIFPGPSLLQLKTVDITWHVRDASIIPVIEFLLENAHVLEKMVLRLTKHEAYPEFFISAEEEVMSMRRSSPYAKVIISKDG